MVDGLNQVNAAGQNPAANVPPPAPDPASFNKKIEAAVSGGSSGSTAISKGSTPALLSAATGPSSAAVLSEQGSKDVHIPVTVLQTPDTSAESKSRRAPDANGNTTDYSTQSFNTLRDASDFISNAIRLSDTPPATAPSTDPETRSQLAAYGFTVDANGEIHLGDPSANGFPDGTTEGFFLALATTRIGNEVAPDISEQLRAAGADADVAVGYEAGRAFTLARFGTPVDDGPILLLASSEGDTSEDNSITVQTSEGFVTVDAKKPIPIDDAPLPDDLMVLTVSFDDGQSVSIALANGDAQKLFDEVGAGDHTDLTGFLGGSSQALGNVFFATNTVINARRSQAITSATDPNESEAARHAYELHRSQIPPASSNSNAATNQTS